MDTTNNNNNKTTQDASGSFPQQPYTPIPNIPQTSVGREPCVDHREERLVETPPRLRIDRNPSHPFRTSFSLLNPPRRDSNGSTRRRRNRLWEVHTSCVDFFVDKTDDETEEETELEISQLNIVWGKTIDATQISSPSAKEDEVEYRSELCIDLTHPNLDEDRPQTVPPNSPVIELSPSIPSLDNEPESPDVSMLDTTDHNPLEHSDIFIYVDGDGSFGQDPKFVSVWTETEEEDESEENVSSSDVSFSQHHASDSDQTSGFDHRIQFVSEFKSNRNKTVSLSSSYDDEDPNSLPSPKTPSAGTETPPSDGSSLRRKKSIYKVSDTIASLGGSNRTPRSVKKSVYVKLPGDSGKQKTREMFRSTLDFPSPTSNSSTDDSRKEVGDVRHVGRGIAGSKVNKESSGIYRTVYDHTPSRVRNSDPVVRRTPPKSCTERSEEIVSTPKERVTHKKGMLPPYNLMTRYGNLDPTVTSHLSDSVGQMEDEASDGTPFIPIKPKKKRKKKKKKAEMFPDSEYDDTDDVTRTVPDLPLPHELQYDDAYDILPSPDIHLPPEPPKDDAHDMIRTLPDIPASPTTLNTNENISDELDLTGIPSLVFESKDVRSSTLDDGLKNAPEPELGSLDVKEDDKDEEENVSRIAEIDNGDSPKPLEYDSRTLPDSGNEGPKTIVDDVDLGGVNEERRERDTKSTERSEEFFTPDPPKSVVSEVAMNARPILKPFKRYWNKEAMRSKRERNKSNILNDGASLKPLLSPTIPVVPSQNDDDDTDDPKRGQKRKMTPTASHEVDEGQDEEACVELEDGGFVFRASSEDGDLPFDRVDSTDENNDQRHFRTSLSEELRKLDEVKDTGEEGSDDDLVGRGDWDDDETDNKIGIEDYEEDSIDVEKTDSQSEKEDDMASLEPHGSDKHKEGSTFGPEMGIDRCEVIEIRESPVSIKRNSGSDVRTHLVSNDDDMSYTSAKTLTPGKVVSCRNVLIHGVTLDDTRDDEKGDDDVDDTYIDDEQTHDDENVRNVGEDNKDDNKYDDEDENVWKEGDVSEMRGDENDNVLFKYDDDDKNFKDNEVDHDWYNDDDDDIVDKGGDRHDVNENVYKDEDDEGVVDDKDDNETGNDEYGDEDNQAFKEEEDRNVHKDDLLNVVYKDEEDNDMNDDKGDERNVKIHYDEFVDDSDNETSDADGQRGKREEKEEVFFHQEEGDDDLDLHDVLEDDLDDDVDERNIGEDIRQTDRKEVHVESRPQTLLYRRPVVGGETERDVPGLKEMVLEYSDQIPLPVAPPIEDDVNDSKDDTDRMKDEIDDDDDNKNKKADGVDQEDILLVKEDESKEDSIQFPSMIPEDVGALGGVAQALEPEDNAVDIGVEKERASDSENEDKKKGKKRKRKKKKKKKKDMDDSKVDSKGEDVDLTTKNSDTPDVKDFSVDVEEVLDDNIPKVPGEDVTDSEMTGEIILLDDTESSKSEDIVAPEVPQQSCYVERQEIRIETHLPETIVVSKQLLEDVISNKARAEQVVAEYPEAAFLDIPLSTTTTSSDKELTTTLTQGSHLMSEMNRLEESARDQRDSLRLAVSEQEKYESEIRQLNAAISEAQHKLMASPVLATSVGALKQQIAEHNTLAAQIKDYQEKVKDINDKSRELALNSAQLSPSVFRKHYLPESAYSDFFSAAAHNRANSPLPSTSPMNSDTIYTFETQSPRSYDSMPEHSKDFVPKQSAPLLLAGVPSKSELMYAKVLQKTESPVQVSRASLNESYPLSLSNTTGYETPPSSARSYDTPLSSARSLSPSSARTIKGTFVIPIQSDKGPQMSKTVLESGPLTIKTSESSSYQSPRGVSSFDSGMESSTFSPHTLQSQPSPSLSVSSMAERLNKLQRDRSKPPPGGQPTELLRMQDSPERHSTSLSSLKSDYDDTIVGTPRSTPRDSTVISPRTPLNASEASLTSQSPAKFRSPRLQALSSSWKSASDSDLAHSTPRSSREYQRGDESPRSYTRSKVIKGTTVIQSPRTDSTQSPRPVMDQTDSVDPMALLRIGPPSETSTPRNKPSVRGPHRSLPSKDVGSFSSPVSSVTSDFQSLTLASNLKYSQTPKFSTASSSPRTVSYPRRSPGNLMASLGISSFSISDSKDCGFQTSSSGPVHSVTSASSSTNPKANLNRYDVTPKTSSSSSSDSSKYFDASSSSLHSNPYLSLEGNTRPNTSAAFVDLKASSNAAVFGASGRDSKVPVQLESLDAPHRERSSSFGAEVAPMGRPLGQVKDGSQTKELDVSFNTLQEQVMSKEKELQASLQRQERYQHTVQGLTAKMERAYMKLDQSPASVAAPLEAQIADHKATVSEIESIKDDIAKVKDIIHQAPDTPDSDGQKAMDATLTMLNDRFSNLKTLADDKGQQLQEALKDREKHSIALKAYNNRVGDLKKWLDEAKVRQSASGLVSEEPHALRSQLDDNREMQEQVNARLQQLSDLALQCDALCDKQPPAQAEKLRNELAALQNQLGQFKMATIEKQANLRADIKDAEKRKREMDELDTNVQRLQKWMTDTKEMTKPTVLQPVAVVPDFHKELATDLKKHKQLVRQLSKRGLRSAPLASSASKPLSDKDVSGSWERLSRELSQKTRNLEDTLRTKKPGELVQVSLHAPARQADSSRQLEEVTKVLGDLAHCWDQLQDKELQKDDVLSFQQQYQSALQNVSGWLELAQQQLFTVPSTTEEHIRQNENLQKEIRSLGVEVAAMSEQGDELMKSAGGAANQDMINSCLSSLNNRIKLMEDTAQAQSDDLKNASRQWKQYQDEVAELQRHLQETQKLVLAPSSTQSLDQLMSNNQNIEAQLKKCETELRELKSKESALTKAYPKGVFPSELATLQSNYMELQRRAQEKKASLQKSVSVQDQYQKMLMDYASFVETAQDKLRNDSIAARDLNHLKQQLTTHKDFFSDLEVHKAILDSLCSQCDDATKAKHKTTHQSLTSLTHVLVDQASLHGQRLERLTRQWTELDEKHILLQRSLSSLESQIPRPIASGDSLVTIQDKLSKYKRLQLELSDERGTVFEVVDRGKQILHSIHCPTLETAVADLAEKWVALNTDLTHELKRTETLGDQLSIFEAEAAVFVSWLSTAKMKNASFKTLSPSDVQNIGAIRSKVEKVLEFRKEVENQAPLKNKVIKVGNELLQNKNYDTRGLSDRLKSYEEEWAQLEKGISETEEFLHQAQMDLMPSRQALNELIAWIQEIKESLKEDAAKRVVGVADIEVMVKKYKGYKVELASKQMTLDFVNQSVLAPSPGEQDVSHEKLDFAEKLGDLNKQWKDVVNAVNERLDSLQGVQGKWEEYERAHQRLQAWIKEQEDKITRYKLIGQEVGVKQTIRDCKSMQQQLQHKQSDLDSINSLGRELIQLSKDSHGCQQSVRDSMSSLEQNWKRLEEQSRQLENLLTDILGQWARYHADLASLNQVITKTEYCLNQYTLVDGDISTLTSQVARIKGHKSDLENHSSHLESFSYLANQLKQLCEAPVQHEIQKTVEDIQSKWKRLQADLSTRCCLFENTLANWQEYESLYNKIRHWLDAKEQLCSDLITMRDDPTKRKESLRKSKELQTQLDDVQGQVSELYRLSDLLTKNMNTSTIVILTSRQSAIEQRLLALRQILSQHMATLSDDLSQLGQFNEAFEVVKKFLSYAESVLVHEDPTKSAESVDIQIRLDQLKRLLSQFMGNMVKLDHVNDLGYRLALNTVDAARLHDLNHKWQDLYENTNERVRTLQGHLLIQQDFTSKCEAWMTFLAQTEQDLASEIQTNLPGLKEQLRKCEQFESDMYSRQQILHAIISDGRMMMRAGEVEDREEFQQKLQLLSEQWHSVTRRAHQRRAMIESLINQWRQFNSMSRQLQQWLQDKERAMKAFEFDSTSLQSVRALVERVKTTEREFKLQEASFKKIHDLGNNLIQRADAKSASEIKATLDELQKSWYNVFSQLDDHRSRLEGMDRQWLECEEDIEDILRWLKDIRQVLHADIPTSYDDLQADLNKCKDIASSFVNSEDRRQRLLSKEKQLGKVVQADDLNLLHQRIRLLNKQWEELQHQTLIREQRLTEAMFRWNNLGDRIRALFTWISNMEAKVTSTRDMHVEDLLMKMETEYKDEMSEKEMEKNEIFDHGRLLMRMSSEIRASDMEQKLLRIEDKWNHLKAVMDFRHRKLQETVLAVKQLDVSMKNLSQWLAKMEQELSSSIAYKGSHVREIQKKLHHTQEIQQDIEQHSAGVSAVLNLCEVLLHDSDACPTEVEFNALQHAMKNLEKRWKNICSLSPQRRTRVEETWQLWELFREDCRKFSDWLSQAEREVRDSETDSSNLSVAKEEIKKYENLQRKVHDQLSMLEHINRQYRHLAKEGRTDTDGSLKIMMTDLNNRWDALQLKVTEIMKRLRHSSSIRGDFESTHSSLMAWLTEMDMTLTSLESLDSHDWNAKLLEIQRIEDEIDNKRHRIAYLDQAAVYLMQKGDSQDALRVQQKLEDFRTFSKSVLERIVPIKLRIERMLVAENENQQEVLRSAPSAEDRLREIREAQTTATLEKQTAELEAYLEASPPESPPTRRRPDASPSRVAMSATHRTGSPLRRAGAQISRSRSPSPLRSSSPVRRSFSPVRQVAAARGSRSPSRMAVDFTDARRSRSPSPRLDIAQREKSAKIEILMEQLVETLDEANVKLARVEKALSSHRPNSEHCLRLLVDCETAVDSVRRLDRLLKTETGVMSIASADTQVKVVLERWEHLQKLALAQDFRMSQERQDLIQFNNDLDSMLTWLAEAEALQSTHRSLPVDVTQLDLIVRQYKDFLVQLEAKKATILSINLLSRNYMGSTNDDTRQMKSKLNDMNSRWDMVMARASEIQQKLQLALIQCQEFHQSINDYEIWSEAIEAKVHQCEPLNLNADDTSLLPKYSKLSELRNELQRNQSKVQSLKGTVDQLLVSSDSPEMLTARDKAHIINNRVRSLLHLTSAYVSSLENRLKAPSKKGSASSSFDLSEGRSSGLGSSPASRSSTPLRVGTTTTTPSIRSRRSPFTLSRQFDYRS